MRAAVAAAYLNCVVVGCPLIAEHFVAFDAIVAASRSPNRDPARLVIVDAVSAYHRHRRPGLRSVEPDPTRRAVVDAVARYFHMMRFASDPDVVRGCIADLESLEAY